MNTINVSLQGRGYDIEIGSNIAKKLIPQFENIITDTNVYAYYQKLLKGRKDIYVIPAGEESKSFEQYRKLAIKLKDVEEIAILGGGVPGDLGGFLASTIRRGVPLVQIPTSLVAMVDSSIGGKNGINLEERKNYLGNISQPVYVLTDLDFLKTLPEKEFRNGKAEIIKYAGIDNDPELLERMQSNLSLDSEDLEEVIISCIGSKRHFVERDERDENARHALNFGHTIGHALEIPYGLSHGDAIAIGMVYESILGNSDEKTNLIINALKANDLPTQLPKNANIDEIIELMRSDKKGPLVISLDEWNHKMQIDEKEIREVLERKIKKEDYEEGGNLPF